ncbi:MAG: hypothetical protein WB580_02065 [Candidatus Binataceae bacterium]
MRVDNGRNGVGRVVKSIDELEAERDQQRAAEHDEWPDGRGVLDGKVGNQMRGRIEHARGEDQSEDNNPAQTRAFCEFLVKRSFCGYRSFDGRGHSGLPSASLSGLNREHIYLTPYGRMTAMLQECDYLTWVR